MILDTLCDRLDQAGVTLSLDGDTVRVSAPRGRLSPELRQAIADHKPALIDGLAGFRQLDAGILDSEAGRRPLADIETRLARLTAIATRPTATSLDRQLVRDWTAIRDAKYRQRQATERSNP